jgi:hypothetical protein
MKPSPLAAAFLALGLVVGCGKAPTVPRTTPSTSFQSKSVAATPPPSGGDPNDLTKNPMVVWIKQAHPDTAAQIIDDYLSLKPVAANDPMVSGNRDQLRQQAVGMVVQQFTQNLRPNLPKGIIANPDGTIIHVTGVTVQQGFNISVGFDFDVQIDATGMIWIWQPTNSVHASSGNMLVKLFGGDLDSQARKQITKALDDAAPKAVANYKGVGYIRGGTFKIDPGLAFVNMPS